MKRAIAVAALLALTAAGIMAAVTWEPPAVDCAALLRQAEHSSDVGTQIEEAGCDEPMSPARQISDTPGGTVP